MPYSDETNFDKLQTDGSFQEQLSLRDPLGQAIHVDASAGKILVRCMQSLFTHEARLGFVLDVYMAKRVANTYLTASNFDDDDAAPEEVCVKMCVLVITREVYVLG